MGPPCEISRSWLEKIARSTPSPTPLTTGCSISVVGQVVESQGKGQQYEIQARELSLVGEADPESYPLQKKATHARVPA